MASEKTPWPAMLAAAARLGVAPQAFWRLAVREWRALAGAGAAQSLSRREFEALAAKCPDAIA